MFTLVSMINADDLPAFFGWRENRLRVEISLSESGYLLHVYKFQQANDMPYCQVDYKTSSWS